MRFFDNIYNDEDRRTRKLVVKYEVSDPVDIIRVTGDCNMPQAEALVKAIYLKLKIAPVRTNHEDQKGAREWTFIVLGEVDTLDNDEDDTNF